MKQPPAMIPLKQWLYEESERQGASVRTIEGRLWRGRYPGIQLKRVNARVIFVLNEPRCELQQPGPKPSF